METYSFEFLPQNEIFKFVFTKDCNQRWKATCLKSRMQKKELKNFHFQLKKSSFFNEIPLEFKALKLPQDNMEREESQTCLIEGHKQRTEIIQEIDKIQITFY